MTTQPSVRASQPAIVVVLGMHRAGTSLLANILSELTGATDGPFLLANEYNEKGYWEDARIVAIHERVLAKLKREWGAMRSSFPYPEQWWASTELHAEREDLKALVAERTHASSERGAPWVVKDPRMSRLFPLWTSILSELGIRADAVLALRHPAAVAASLAKRDGFPPSLSWALWLSHYTDAILDARQYIRLVVPYDNWFAAPEETLRSILSNLDLGEIDEEKAVGAVRSVADPKLRHHKGDGDAPKLLTAMFEQLKSWPPGGDAPEALIAIASGVKDTLAAFQAWQIAEEDEHYLADAQRRREEQLQPTVDRLAIALSEYEAMLEWEKSEHRRAAKVIEMRDNEITALKQELASAQSQNVRAEAALAHSNAELEAKERQISDLLRSLNHFQQIAGQDLSLHVKLTRLIRDHFDRGENE